MQTTTQLIPDLSLLDMRHVSAHVSELHLKRAVTTLSQPKKRPWRLLGPLAILVLSLFGVLSGDRPLPDPARYYYVHLDVGGMWVHYRGKVDYMMNLPATAEVGDAYHDAQGVLWVYMPGVNPTPWYDP